MPVVGGSRGAGPLMDRIREMARRCFDDTPGSHDWDHTLRVYCLCERIGPEENAEMTILRAAAYLHDIGRTHQDRSQGEVCHAVKGAEMAAAILNQLGLSPGQTENILHCIRSHRFRGNGSPRTIEARVLFDADKLDSIGAVGIARAYQFAGEVGAILHNPDNCIDDTRPYTRDDTGYREYRVKLCRIKDRMLTRTGRRLAEDRHGFMAAFFDRLLEEVAGRR
ncbi:MAG: HD domain-containing protein [Desulfobacterales bacterium]